MEICAEVRAQAWFFLRSLAAEGLDIMLAALREVMGAGGCRERRLGHVHLSNVGNDRRLWDYEQVQKCAERMTQHSIQELVVKILMNTNESKLGMRFISCNIINHKLLIFDFAYWISLWITVGFIKCTQLNSITKRRRVINCISAQRRSSTLKEGVLASSCSLTASFIQSPGAVSLALLS